jgi:hypothetical protein
MDQRTGLQRSEAAPEDHLDDESVSGACETPAHSEVDFPTRVDVEIHYAIELLLLPGGWREVADWPQRPVVLDPEAHRLRQVVAHLGRGRELDACLRAGALEALLEGRVDREVPACQ